MKYIIAIFAIASLTLAQPNDRFIEVRGTGSVKTMPDLGILNVELNAVAEKFVDAVKGLNGKTDKLIAQLQMTGFKKEEIKTTDFSVSKNIVWQNNTNVDKGYIASQNITVDFPNTKEKIGMIITSFMSSENDVRFSFSFTLSEAKEKLVKYELLKLVVEDAQSRAEVLASAARQTIGTIKNISYGTPSQIPMVQTAMLKRGASDSEQSPGFDVKEMSLSDEVTIVWELK